jgi:low affinity Fe/Cu permease
MEDMGKQLKKLELIFEKLVTISLNVFSHPVTFIVALILTLFWLLNKDFFHQSLRDDLRDIISAITFLCFFLIQKSFNKFSTALHVKLNELLASHDKASNRIVNIEEKSEAELKELSKHYTTLSKNAHENQTLQTSQSIEHVIANKLGEQKEDKPENDKRSSG